MRIVTSGGTWMLLLHDAEWRGGMSFHRPPAGPGAAGRGFSGGSMSDVKPATDEEVADFIDGYAMVDDGWAAVVMVGIMRCWAARIRADAAQLFAVGEICSSPCSDKVGRSPVEWAEWLLSDRDALAARIRELEAKASWRDHGPLDPFFQQEMKPHD